MADNASPEFRAESATHLRSILSALYAWNEAWDIANYGDGGSTTLSPPEYPFKQELGELIADVAHAIDLLEREPEPETSDTRIYPSLTWLENHGIVPDPRGDPISWQDVAEGYSSGRWHRVSGPPIAPTALNDFRAMVTAFRGGYHPDTRPECYVDYPTGYDATRVTAIEHNLEALGYDLCSEALRVLSEVHDG